MTNQVRAVIYARVSDERKQGENTSLPDQVADCQRYCERQGYQIVDIFEDKFTGVSNFRPELDKITELARKRAIDVMVVAEPDRLARTIADRLIIKDRLANCLVDIEWARMNIAKTSEGELQEAILAAAAEYERKKIVERTQRGRKSYAKAGKVAASRLAPYGYRYTTKQNGGNGQFVIDPDEARIVELIFNWLVRDRLALNAIAQKLTAMSIPTAHDRSEREANRKNPLKTKERGVWAKSSVGHIVKNELYAGVAWFGQTVKTDKIGADGLPVIDPRTGRPKRVQVPRPKDEQIAVPVPAIVSRELWEAAQERLEENVQLSKRNRKGQYLLGGLCKCSRCGLSLCGQNSRGHTRYRCGGNLNTNAKDGHTITCSGAYNANMLETLVWDAISTYIKQPERIIAAMRGKQEQSSEAVQVLQLNALTLADSIAAKRTEKQKIWDAYTKTDRLTLEAWQELDRALDADIASLEKDLAAAQVRLAETEISEETIEQVEAFCGEVAEGIDLFTFEDKRFTLERLKVRGILQRNATEDSDALIITGWIPLTEIPLPKRGTDSGNIATTSQMR